MCGIAGIIDWGGAPVSPGELAALQKSLYHRGPDARGTWRSDDGRVGLAHTRLSILDTSAGANQPMLGSHGRYVIIFNGEIYNFLELRQELLRQGYDFRTESDTEVLLRGWEFWGEDLFARLNGMWAFAIHDTVSGRTTLCRDRYGVKPLFYCCRAGRCCFASEVQAIDRLLGFSLSPDAAYLGRISHLEAGDGSYLEGVQPLPAGCYMEIQAHGETKVHRWYRLMAVSVPGTLKQQADQLRSLVIDACALRLRSDVPVATCLSGGLDSGSLVALLHQATALEPRFPGFNHRAFIAAFPGTTLDETDAARLVAQKYGVDLIIEPVDAPTPEQFEAALAACDGPMPTLAFYPIWKLYSRIRQQGIAVTLDGIGPDEVLGGYYLGAEAMAAALRDGRLLRLIDCYRTYAALYPEHPGWIRGDLIGVLRAALSRRKQAFRLRRPEARSEDSMAAGLSGSLRDNMMADFPLDDDPFARALLRQFFVAPLPFFLHQYDRASMSNGVECRMPFMDYRVVEYLFSLPLESRVGGGYTKRVLREAVRGVLPDPVRLNRRKTGFNAPFRQWLQGPLRQWALDTAADTAFQQNPMFDGRAAAAQLQKAVGEDPAPIDERLVWPALHAAWWMAQRRQQLAA